MAPRNLRYAAGVVLVLVLALGFLPEHPQAGPSWEKLPVFEALFGLLGCLLIILVYKALGRLVQKKEDYYDG